MQFVAHSSRAEPDVEGILFMEIIWALSLPPHLNNYSRSGGIELEA